MNGQVQSVRGMNDVLPEQQALWQTLDAACASVFCAYGYQRMRLPVMERTELFRRAVGEVTDIVEKEMYSFADRSGVEVSLRPEATAGCVRAAVEHGLLHNQTQRLWYTGPMFRHERPQKGRYRQFHQFGVEAFGLLGPDIDAEQIAMSARLWRRLGLADLQLEINSLGTVAERAAYRDVLINYLHDHIDALDDDSQRRLHSNPMRVLDSKNPALAPILEHAPVLADYLGAASGDHFAELRGRLDVLGISYRVNPRLVRGLDYYTRTVYEWRTQQLGAQDAVCSGGRYDDLVAQLGGGATPAVGFALGVERLVALMQLQQTPLAETAPHAYLVHQGERADNRVWQLAESLRQQLPGLRLQVHAGGGSFRSQFRRADRSGARLGLVLGDDEAAGDQIQIKHLRADCASEVVPQAGLACRLEQLLFNQTHRQGTT
ncbi:MAG: histidine--tRNA ligase [Salinisphaera sp.]|nr:histidine--tRNA ligase [Salinisphaera sp.]